MTTNASKAPQAFDITYTTENDGKVPLDIDVNVTRILLRKITKTIPTNGVVAMEFYGDDLDKALVHTAGAAGALTPSIKYSGVIAKGARTATLDFSDLTKATGLELDFGINKPLPMVGDAVELQASDAVAGDSRIFGRRLFVISVTGTKAKLMAEVPSGVKLPTKGNIFVKVTAVSGKQPIFSQGFDVTSTSRSGNLVTFKGSIPMVYGVAKAQGLLVLTDTGSLVSSLKKRSRFSKSFTIVSSKVGELVVIDDSKLIETVSLGTDFAGTAEIKASGGFTLMGSSVNSILAYSLASTLIDMKMINGAAVGDEFKVYAFYGGNA